MWIKQNRAMGEGPDARMLLEEFPDLREQLEVGVFGRENIWQSVLGSLTMR